MEWKTSGEGRREGDATGRKWGEGKEEERRFASTTEEGEITAPRKVLEIQFRLSTRTTALSFF